jgi:hypothetical protein
MQHRTSSSTRPIPTANSRTRAGNHWGTRSGSPTDASDQAHRASRLRPPPSSIAPETPAPRALRAPRLALSCSSTASTPRRAVFTLGLAAVVCRGAVNTSRAARNGLCVSRQPAHPHDRVPPARTVRRPPVRAAESARRPRLSERFRRPADGAQSDGQGDAPRISNQPSRTRDHRRDHHPHRPPPRIVGIDPDSS